MASDEHMFVMFVSWLKLQVNSFTQCQNTDQT